MGGFRLNMHLSANSILCCKTACFLAKKAIIWNGKRATGKVKTKASTENSCEYGSNNSHIGWSHTRGLHRVDFALSRSVAADPLWLLANTATTGTLQQVANSKVRCPKNPLIVLW